MAATTPQYVGQTRDADSSGLQEAAKRHLWMHFTRMSAYEDADVPILVRGEGCYVYDEHGKRYLDGLSALFCVNAGHGRAEIADAMGRQARELAFYTNWSYAHPGAIALAERIANLAPEGFDRVFFTSGGSEAVESALQARARLAQAQRGGGPLQADRAGDRVPRHYAWARCRRPGIPALREPFEPMLQGGCHVPTPTPTAGPRTATRCGRPTRSRSGSSSRGPRPCRR